MSGCTIKQRVRGYVRMKRLFIALVTLAAAVCALPALAASNPFMDVPANHWAYDAVAQLASRGVISGYPDGSYKGGQPATRYEMASIVGRTLAKADIEKAGKQDLDLLKKLVLEFKDELDALGVKTDKLGGRMEVMEKDLGGWNLSGQLRLDARLGADENHTGWLAGVTGKNEFDMNRYRLFIKKRIDENTSFTARLGGAGNSDEGKTVIWEQYYITTKLPYDIKLTFGRTDFDFEGLNKLYHYFDNDAIFHSNNKQLNLFMFEKDWGMANLRLTLARDNDRGWTDQTRFKDGLRTAQNVERFLVAANANFNFTERFNGGLLAYYYMPDKEVQNANTQNIETDSKLGTYGVYLRYAFMPSLELKGLYYHQVQGETIARMMSSSAPGAAGYDDIAKSWKIMIDARQDLLKFASVWLEYGKMDNNFYHETYPYSLTADDLANQRRARRADSSSTIIGGWAVRKWNEKFLTVLRHYQVDSDIAGLDKAKNWSFGITYQHNPFLMFQFLYDKIDYGTGNPAAFLSGDDHMFRLRTFVTF